MTNFLDGATMLAWIIAALHFRQFWLRTRDPLLGWFARAFGVLALSRLALVVIGRSNEASAVVYLLRLVAFGLIITGIWITNLRPRARESDGGPQSVDVDR